MQNSVYGKHAIDVSTVRCCVRHFKIGEAEIEDKTQSGQPAMAVTTGNKSRTDVLIMQNFKQTATMHPYSLS
jgi:hypothetical protein